MRIFVRAAIKPRTRWGAAVSSAMLAVCGTQAHAQQLERDPLQVQDREQAQTQNRDRIVVGVGVSYAPTYRGADDYRVLPLPVLDVKWGRFFLNLRNGAGINVIENEHLTVGAGITYVQGYRSKDVPEGIDNLDLGAGARAFATYRGGGLIASVGATKGFAGGSKGILADASLSYPIQVAPRWTLTPSVATTWADKKYNNDYYGVDSVESLASGLPQFQGRSGFRDASASLTALYRLTDQITLSATGSVSTIIGTVQDSPLVLKKTRPSGFIAASYRF